MVNKYSYGTTTGTSSDAVIHTNSSEETHRYLERSAHNIYVDPNPQIIRRSHTDGPIRAEQRVTIRYLQPPPLPPPEVMPSTVYKCSLSNLLFILANHYQRSAPRTASTTSTAYHTRTPASFSFPASTYLA